MLETSIKITLLSNISHYISLFHLFQILNTDLIIMILFANIDRASDQQANSLNHHSLPSLVIIP